MNIFLASYGENLQELFAYSLELLKTDIIGYFKIIVPVGLAIGGLLYALILGIKFLLWLHWN